MMSEVRELPGINRESDGLAGGDPRVVFALKLGHALHRYGIPTHRLEAAMNAVLLTLGLEGHFFSMPTGVMASFGPPEQHRTSLIRVEPSEVDLEKQSLLDELVGRVLRRKLSAAEGIKELDAIVSAPARHGPLTIIFAFGLASCAATTFFGGGWREAVASGLIGIIIGAFSTLVKRSEDASRVFEPAASLIAAAMAVTASLLFYPLSFYVTTLAGVIVLVPGFTVTTAVRELATRNLVSGTARLMGAALIFFEIGFGVALGAKLVSLVGVPAVSVAPEPLPGWTLYLSLLLAPLGFTVLLRARYRDLPAILVACMISFAGARAGASVLGPQLGVCIGAAVVGSVTNLYARLFNRPSSVPLVPAILLLVPGSIGFGSFQKFLERDVVSGIDTAFNMLLVAVALVTGLLVSNLIVSPRKAL
jgi:uncharacterized membrane protein YjjP (DUF1212 family)